MGTVQGPYRALVSALADTLWELTGYLLVRTTALAEEGDVVLTVEATDRWPDSGRFVFLGVIHTYSGRTATTFTGIAQLHGGAGVVGGARPGTAVMEWSRTVSDLDKLRGSFFVRLADGAELTTLGRNYGLDRPRGVDDETWRAVLGVMIYLDAQTMWACQKVLDALLGPDNYELWEDLESFPHTVFVSLGDDTGTVYAGRTFLVGGEAHARATVTTVVATYVPSVIYGVYDSADPGRTGENYAAKVLSSLSPGAPDPDSVSSAALFLASDVGKDLVWQDGTGQTWRIVAFTSTSLVTVAGQQRSDGAVNTVDPDVLVTERDWWRAWHLGHTVTVSGSPFGNDGTYVIAEVLSPRSVRLTGATFTTEAAMTYQVVPAFAGDEPSFDAEVLRATNVGTTITTPRNMPANVLVDYGTVPSAQVLDSELVSGADQYPFYFYDGLATAVALLDLITAAGVRVVAVRE